MNHINRVLGQLSPEKEKEVEEWYDADNERKEWKLLHDILELLDKLKKNPPWKFNLIPGKGQTEEALTINNAYDVLQQRMWKVKDDIDSKDLYVESY